MIGSRSDALRHRGVSASRGRRFGGSGLMAIAALAVVFVAGAMAGVVADRYYISHRAPAERAARDAPLPRGLRIEPPLDSTARRALATGIPVHMLHLGLTPQQESTLTSIARRRRPQADSIMEALRPVARNLETTMMQEMLCALTPAQQAHWRAYMDTLGFDPAIANERYRPAQTHACNTITR